MTDSAHPSKQLALIMWVLTIFFSFIPSLVLFIVKRDDEYVLDQATEALNWSITAFIGYAIASVLFVVGIGALLYPLIGLCNLIFCILAVIGTSKGERFRVPFAIRLL